jgi:hypothetical protein
VDPLTQELIDVLERDIKEWESLASFFQTNPGDYRDEHGNVVVRKDPRSYTARANQYRILVQRLKDSATH